MDSCKIETVAYQNAIADIKKIRTKVFQQEQGVAAELEFDGLDDSATHLLAYLNNQAVGTSRIRAIDNQTVKIERLAVLPEARKQGVGTKLMQTALKTISRQPQSQIIVHAQTYIAHLYQRLGFAIIGEQFTEAGIDHVKMIKTN